MITQYLHKSESLSYLHNMEDTDIIALLDDADYVNQLYNVMARELFDVVVAHNIRYIFAYIGAPDGLLFAETAVAFKRQYPNRSIKIGAFYLAGDIELLPSSLQSIVNDNFKRRCDMLCAGDREEDSEVSLKLTVARTLADNAFHYIHFCNKEKALNLHFEKLRETVSCIYPVNDGFAIKRYGPQD